MPRIEPGRIRQSILTLTLAAVTVACGADGSSVPNGLPVADGSAPPVAAASGDAGSPLPSGAITDPLVAWPAFAACLRAHGLQIADPQVDANGDPHWGDDLKRLITDTVREACNPIIAAIDEGGTLKGGRPRHTYSFDSEVAHAACMREHGFPDWPDPNPNEERGVMPPGFDKADAAVRAGLIACEPLLVETSPSPSPGV
jgi:hypothetical protein